MMFLLFFNYEYFYKIANNLVIEGHLKYKFFFINNYPNNLENLIKKKITNYKRSQ